MTKNRGFIPEEPRDTDWEFLGSTQIVPEVLQPDGQWDGFLPTFELQRNNLFDSWSCVSYARNNVLETIHKRKYGIEPNYSDRFTSIMTGTVPKKGNGLASGGDKARKTGEVDESVYPSITPEMTEQQFFLQPPQDIKDLGLFWLKDYSIFYEWVDKFGGSSFNIEKVKEALKYAPLQTAIDSSTKHRSQFNGWNDSVMIYGFEEGKYWKVFGSYPETTGNFDWDYPFFNPLKWHMDKLKPLELNQNSMSIEKATLIRSNETGKIYLLAGGIKHWIVDEPTFIEFFGKEIYEAKDWNNAPDAEIEGITDGADITRPLAPGLRQIIDIFINAVKKLGNKLGIKK